MRTQRLALGRRLLEYGVTFIAAITVNFVLPYVAPGDPLRYLIGQEVNTLSAAERQELLSTYGLDQPLYVQYADYLLGIVQGDLGTSVMYGQPVWDVLLGRLPWTLLLVGSALVLSTVLGTLLGAWSAWREGERSDIGVLTVNVAAESAPAFWVGMLLVSVFVSWLGWFPSYGITGGAGGSALTTLLAVPLHLALPLLTGRMARERTS